MEDKGEETVVNMSQNAQEKTLDDDKVPQEGQFVGATLQIGGDTPSSPPDVDFAGPGLNRNRPGSTIGRQSVRSTTSRTSMRTGGHKTDKMVETFFCVKSCGPLETITDTELSEARKENNIDKAIKICKEAHWKQEIDGEVTGQWLLTQIDHWDNEKEKLVALSENSLLIFQYNFINDKILDFKRISLHVLDSILIGDFKYPEYSLMPKISSDRNHGGVQIQWGRSQPPSFGQVWNPWCTTIPWVTFCHHPLIYNPKESETVTYNVDDFYESLVTASSKCFSRKRPGEKVMVIEGPIEITSYLSVSSLVYNQSSLGFCRDRNGVSY